MGVYMSLRAIAGSPAVSPEYSSSDRDACRALPCRGPRVSIGNPSLFDRIGRLASTVNDKGYAFAALLNAQAGAHADNLTVYSGEKSTGFLGELRTSVRAFLARVVSWLCDNDANRTIAQAFTNAASSQIGRVPEDRRDAFRQKLQAIADPFWGMPLDMRKVKAFLNEFSVGWPQIRPRQVASVSPHWTAGGEKWNTHAGSDIDAWLEGQEAATFDRGEDSGSESDLSDSESFASSVLNPSLVMSRWMRADALSVHNLSLTLPEPGFETDGAGERIAAASVVDAFDSDDLGSTDTNSDGAGCSLAGLQVSMSEDRLRIADEILARPTAEQLDVAFNNLRGVKDRARKNLGAVALEIGVAAVREKIIERLGPKGAMQAIANQQLARAVRELQADGVIVPA